MSSIYYISNFKNLINNYVESHFQDPKSLTDAAYDLGMTSKSFGEYFKKNFGITYTKYVRKQQMKYAALTLRKKQLFSFRDGLALRLLRPKPFFKMLPQGIRPISK